MHLDVRDRGLDLRHMAADALATPRTWGMMRVPRNISGPRAIGGCRAVALQTDDGGRLEKIGVVLGAVNVVTTEAGDAVEVHFALHKIVALHAIFMRGVIGEMGEGGLS